MIYNSSFMMSENGLDNARVHYSLVPFTRWGEKYEYGTRRYI